MKPRRHWLDEPRNIMRLWRGFLVVLALTVVAEFLVVMHPAFEAESLFAFPAMYGFFTCVAMIVVAKALGFLLKRPDRYYRDDDD
jgi:membrane protease YdiL (CAAX protease family)